MKNSDVVHDLSALKGVPAEGMIAALDAMITKYSVPDEDVQAEVDAEVAEAIAEREYQQAVADALQRCDFVEYARLLNSKLEVPA